MKYFDKDDIFQSEKKIQKPKEVDEQKLKELKEDLKKYHKEHKQSQSN